MSKLRIYFTSATGHEAIIEGDEAAVRAIEDIFDRAGVRVNDQGAWEEQTIEPDDDYAQRAEWKAHRGKK